MAVSVHEGMEKLKKVRNQNAPLKIIVGNQLLEVKDIWDNAVPVIIEAEEKDDK